MLALSPREAEDASSRVTGDGPTTRGRPYPTWRCRGRRRRCAGADPDTRPAAARVRQFHAGRVGGGAPARAAGDRAAAAVSGHVRVGGTPPSPKNVVPVVPRAEPPVRRAVLAAVRLGGSGRGDIRSGGRVPARRRPAAADLREGAGTRP